MSSHDIFSNPDLQLFLFLFLIAIFAGFLDTLAGGGGLLTLPALLLTGMPPILALGTNKMQATLGTATASLMMLKHKRIRWSEVYPAMIAAFAGSFTGATLIQFVNPQALSRLIPVVLLLISGYFVFSGKILEKVHPVKMSARAYRSSIVPVIGLYDGLFGPGTGSFFSLAGVSLQGKTLLHATAVAKTLNFATNLAALAAFLVLGNIVFTFALVMMLGQACGAWLGAHVLFRANPQYLRMLIVVMCLLMLANYFK